jgi:hypothetical protein
MPFRDCKLDGVTKGGAEFGRVTVMTKVDATDHLPARQ